MEDEMKAAGTGMMISVTFPYVLTVGDVQVAKVFLTAPAHVGDNVLYNGGRYVVTGVELRPVPEPINVLYAQAVKPVA